jgi:alkylhydroperoxidase/carboxymuconolactone decarboxylase family protein YurZ
LSLRERSLLVFASQISQGEAEQQIRSNTRWAFQHSCTPGQLHDLVMMIAAFAGFPRANNGLVIMRDELTMMQKPIDDPK